MIYDIIAAIGLLSLCAGVWAAFGWPFALIILGIALLILGVKGAINEPIAENIQHANSEKE
jgi:hypothetical protein